MGPVGCGPGNVGPAYKNILLVRAGVINSQSSVSSKLLITYRNSACNSSPFTFSFPPSVSLKHIVLFWEREKETEFMSFMNGY